MADLLLYQTCRFCRGTKVMTIHNPPYPPVEVPCMKCDATGIYEIGKIASEDVVASIADILNKVNDIKEKVDEIKAAIDEM